MLPQPGRCRMTDTIAALTQSLARPVTLGMLPAPHARAAVALAVLRAAPPAADLAGMIHIWLHLLAAHIRRLEDQRDLLTHAIKRRLRPMIAARKPWNQLMAAAHDLNGADGFPLAEAEVSDIVRTEVYFNLPSPPRRHPHGR